MDQSAPSELVQAVFDAINNVFDDEQEAAEAFWRPQAEDVSASIWGGPMAGHFSGQPADKWIPCATYRRLGALLSHPIRKRVEIDDILEGEDHAVVMYNVVGENGELDNALRGVLVCRIADGKVSDVQHFDPLSAHEGLRALQE